jgi:hypothetical protein
MIIEFFSPAYMAFNTEQSEQITSMMDDYIERKRPPEHIRSKLDIGWRYDKQAVYVFEMRPQWNDSSTTIHHDVAKAVWVQQAKEWRIFWMRGNLKWYRYDLLPSVGNLQLFLIELDKDPAGCFWG